MKKNLFCLPIICLIVAIGCKSEPKEKSVQDLFDTASKMGTLNVSAQKYGVDVPTGWTTNDTMISNVKMFMMTSPTASDGSEASMNMLNESMQGLSFDEYKASTIKTMQTYVSKMVLLENGEVEANNLKGRWFTYTMESPDGKVDGINYTFPKDGIAYIISGSAPSGQLNTYRGTFEAVAKSFKIKE